MRAGGPEVDEEGGAEDDEGDSAVGGEFEVAGAADEAVTDGLVDASVHFEE